MMYPLVLELAATDALLRVPVAVTCRVLGFSTQAFYKWRAEPVCARDLDDAYLTNAAIDLHADDPEFGYRLIADDLRDAGTGSPTTGPGGCAPTSGCGRCTPRSVG